MILYMYMISAQEREDNARRDRIMQLRLAIDKAQRGIHNPGVQLQIRAMKSELTLLEKKEMFHA